MNHTERELEGCRAWIMADTKWRPFIAFILVITLALLFVYGIWLNWLPDRRTSPFPWQWPMTMFGLVFVAGNFAWKRMTGALFHKRTAALRTTSTRDLIRSTSRWSGAAAKVAGQEMVFRAAHRDRAARAHLHGEFAENITSVTLPPDSRPSFGRKELTVYSPFDGFVTVRARSTWRTRIRPAIWFIVLLGLFLKDVQYNFRGENQFWLPLLAGIGGTLLTFSVPLVAPSYLANPQLTVGGLSTRQLIFVAINGDSHLRGAALGELQARPEDMAARRACGRLGIPINAPASREPEPNSPKRT